ncbi:MAG: hypothetical protein KBA30_09600 [Clostridia bacterium]|nr:hypothetical protein [Clostridia bacterium]
MRKPPVIKPVTSYATPRYPTREGVADDPSVLGALPARWGAKPAVCMALLFTLSTGLAGCRGGSWRNPFGEIGEPAGQVVPVFVHGEGMSTYACVSVAPPVFLSEEEAQNVIREEAERRGVRFTESREIQGNRFPATSFKEALPRDSSLTWKGTLSLDGYDPALGFGFEFVSSKDVRDWLSPSGKPMISSETYDMKSTAERLADAVPDTVVFYDPAADYTGFDFNHDWNTMEAYRQAFEAEQRERMLEDLRAQVRDFLDWLAAQGVI